MSSQHLSDEAVAAFADGVLSGHARDRAGRHTAGCPECARAVREQREAVLALRAAPAPALPVGLLERLRSVPSTTPISGIPATVTSDGSAMFATFGSMAALVPHQPFPSSVQPSSPAAPHRSPLRGRRSGPMVLTAASLAAAGVLAVASSASVSSATPAQQPVHAAPVHVAPVSFRQP
jgi:anti-sigma factor RsiW